MKKRTAGTGDGARLEVHEHSFIAGRHGAFSHAHEGGDKPHEHTDGSIRTGPACYTIDKRDWLRATGSIGRSEKKFSTKPTGPQMPLVVTEPSKIRVIIVGDGGASVAGDCEGAGVLPVARVMLRFKAEIESVTSVPGPGLRRAKGAP